MKQGKQLKVEQFKNYSIIYGSVNHKNPKAIYLDISAWAEPKHEIEFGYSRVIKDINKKIKQSLYDYLNTEINLFSKNKYIVDLDIRESGIKFGKRSFIHCEVTLFSEHELLLVSQEITFMLNDIIKVLIENAFENNRYFKFHRKKK